jgi:hypothetical protein
VRGVEVLWRTITNKPVFITGEDAWCLATQVSNYDVQTYLSDRALRGFNAIWMAAADNTYQSKAPEDFYRNVPFDGADFTNEDATYWAHVDYVVQTAAAYGSVVMLDPGFSGLGGGGYYLSYINSSDAVVYAYGAWIGNRYKNYPNIIWLTGGDADPTDTALYEKLNQLAAGIRSADPNHLIAHEAARRYENQNMAPKGGWSSLDAWGGLGPGLSYTAAGFPPPWLSLNWAYNMYAGTQAGCSRNYASYVTGSPGTPLLMGEDSYEGEASMTALQVREESYWEVLSGCTLGRLFGNNAIWTMGGPEDTMGATWQSQLGSAGSTAAQYQGQLMRSREFWKMAPDTNNEALTGGIGSGNAISVGSCTSDGQTCMVYNPIGNVQPPQIAMAHFSGAVHAWWFNPSTAVTADLGTLTNSGTQTFTPPDGNDWVLVLDLDSANLPAPGSADLD